MTLSTSDTDRQVRPRMWKTFLVYLALSAFCIVFDQVYALFGHGVRSASMTYMFLYPLTGGAVPFLLLWIGSPKREIPGFRLLYNIYNSGIAMLTLQSLLTGIMEIAGTSSPYNILFTICGSILVFAGFAAYLVCCQSAKKRRETHESGHVQTL